LVKDLTGRTSEEIEMPDGATMRDVWERYAHAAPGIRDMQGSILLARNLEFTSRETPLGDGDEVAFLPPVSGGSGPFLREIADAGTGNFFALTREPIDTRAIVDRLLRAEDGAFVDFEGVVRNNTGGRFTLFLDYECYEAMAVNVMAQIGRSIHAAHSIGRIALVHRLGRMQIGETSVAVVVTAPHRKPAFDAALEGIDRLKKLVPIWKKEHFAGGEVWVEGAWDDTVLHNNR
jgi:molybdopterin synthase catalytic subunit